MTWRTSRASRRCIARVYPNGEADVNQFHAAGGMAFVVRELINAGLAHESAMTVWGPGLSAYAKDPFLVDNKLVWRDAAEKSHDEKILRPVSNPFSADGGLKLLRGNLGRSVIKTSARRSEVLGHHRAGARVREPGSHGGGAQGRAQRRFHRRDPRAGSARQRHARAAQADSGDVGLDGQGPARRHRHRRAHVRRLGQGAGGDSPHAGRRRPMVPSRGCATATSSGSMPAPACSKRRSTPRRSQAREAVKPEVFDTTYGVGRELFTRLREGATPADEGASIL